MTVSQLVQAVIAHPEDRGALAALRAAGPAALCDALVAARDDPRAPLALEPVIGDLVGADDVPLLTATALGDDVRTSQFAIAALGASRCEEALPPLVRLATEPGPLVMRRRVAVTALAELRDDRAIAPLLEIVRDLARGDVARAFADATGLGALDHLRLLLDAVASLFKLGEPRPARLAVTLAGAAVAGPDERERWNIRAYAARILQVVAAPGMMSALRASLVAPHAELRRNAAYAAYHLGATALVPDLRAAAAGPDPTLAVAARAQLDAILGDADPSALRDDICYRGGRPLDVAQLLAGLDDEGARPWLLADLRLLTGVDFTTAGAADAQRWWRALPDRPAPGVLIKWGHPQDLRALA